MKSTYLINSILQKFQSPVPELNQILKFLSIVYKIWSKNHKQSQILSEGKSWLPAQMLCRRKTWHLSLCPCFLHLALIVNIYSTFCLSSLCYFTQSSFPAYRRHLSYLFGNMLCLRILKLLHHLIISSSLTLNCVFSSGPV